MAQSVVNFLFVSLFTLGPKTDSDPLDARQGTRKSFASHRKIARQNQRPANKEEPSDYVIKHTNPTTVLAQDHCYSDNLSE